MLQNRRRQRIASIIIGSMGGTPSSADDESHYMNKEMSSDSYEKKDMEKKSDYSGDALEMACGTMLAAIRADDVGLLCRAFKAAYKACEMYEGE